VRKEIVGGLSGGVRRQSVSGGTLPRVRFLPRGSRTSECGGDCRVWRLQLLLGGFI
jgi:hypothetical protein